MLQSCYCRNCNKVLEWKLGEKKKTATILVEQRIICGKCHHIEMPTDRIMFCSVKCLVDWVKENEWVTDMDYIPGENNG